MAAAELGEAAQLGSSLAIDVASAAGKQAAMLREGHLC